MVRRLAGETSSSRASRSRSSPDRTGTTTSVGTSNRGYLRDAIPLADQGTGYRRLRPGEGTRYGTATLLGAIERAAREVAHAYAAQREEMGYPLLKTGNEPAGGAA